MSPLNTFRSFDCESKVETELEGPIESGTTGRVTSLFQPFEEPVSAYWITGLPKKGHHNLCGPQGHVDDMGRTRSRHDPLEEVPPL